jgi:hypothetical protein
MARAELGVQRALIAPDLALIGMGLEGFAGSRGPKLDAGLRAMLTTGYFGGAIGAEYNLSDGEVNFLVRLETPLQRGGLFGSGGMVRFNWYPTESHSFTLGISHPLGQPRAGKTRPRSEKLTIAMEFPPPVPYQVRLAELDGVLDSIRESAEWIRRGVVPFLDQDGRNTRTAEARMAAWADTLASQLARRSAEEEVRFFHAELDRAFTIAAGSETSGRLAAQHARELLLEEVLLPYNSLLGRKKKKDTLVELGIAARGQFGRWVASSGHAPEQRQDQVLLVFQDLLETMGGVRERSAAQWDDPRLVWLPLQFALLPEAHDTQAEIDALIERAVDRKLEPGNQVWYLANLQFHWELLRMIREARRYHVLWIHDFPAMTAGSLDWAAFAQVVDGYLTALADRVEQYDRAGILPQFFIFIDQHYYEARKSRILMTLLEDPLAADGTLAGATEEQNRALLAALNRLRAAINSSRVLQAEARQYGSAWLRNRIKVQVNVTYQSDPTYWGGGLVTSVFGYPDNLMRDHRKLAFYDVSEDDPYEGMAIYTGMGVGQQYLGSSWEDRSLLLNGPALLDLKREARDLLLSQGIEPEELPEVFRERPRGEDWVARVAAHRARGGTDARVLALNNRTGYEAKPLNVAKAILYSLLPPGSVIKIPDSLWNSMFFAGLLAGASCRGVRVMIVAPARANAPSAGFPQMVRAWELTSRLVDVAKRLGPAIERSGGQLRVGLYSLEVRNDAFIDRVDTWMDLFVKTPFLRELMPFVESLMPVARWARARPDPDSAQVGPTFPKLHQKVQFFANRAAWDALAVAPEWPEFMRLYLAYRRTTLYVAGEYREARVFPDRLEAVARRMYARMLTAAGPGAALYAIVGSQNQDYRGMFMDGEVGVLLTGPESLVVLADLVFMDGAVVWLDDRATIDRLLGRPGEFERRVARLAKDAV